MPRRRKIADTAHAKSMVILRLEQKERIWGTDSQKSKLFPYPLSETPEVQQLLQNWIVKGEHAITPIKLYRAPTAGKPQGIWMQHCSKCNFRVYLSTKNSLFTSNKDCMISIMHVRHVLYEIGWHWDSNFFWFSLTWNCDRIAKKGISLHDPLMAPDPF